MAGVRDVGPILLGLIPFGMIVGVSGVGIGMPVIDVVFMSAVVFVGGSLVPSSGHNVLEPAAAGKAVVVGPHMEDFGTDTRKGKLC